MQWPTLLFRFSSKTMINNACDKLEAIPFMDLEQVDAL